MKKKIIIFSLMFFVIALSGCGAVRIGTYLGSKIMPSYVVSAERIKVMAPLFKDNWGYISGFVRGNPYYLIFAPKVVMDSMDRLDVIHKKAKDNSWTDNEKGEMGIKILTLEFEAGKFIRDQYGDEIMALIRSIAGI